MTTQINPVKPSDLTALAKATFATDRMLFISGSGGSGKTTIACTTIAKETGRDVWLVNLSGFGPQEVIGYGIPQQDGDMKFAAPEIWPTEKRVGDKPVLLVLDELPDYDPAVRALLRGLYPASGSRYVGPHKLGSNIAIVVTGNRRSDGTRSAVEDAPFTERCVKVTIEPNVADWLDWYDTQDRLTDTCSHVPAFLMFGMTSGDRTRDHFSPPIELPYTGEPHPTPRTWEAVVLAEPIRKLQPETYKQFVIGSIGERSALPYFAFVQQVDRLPDLMALRSNYKSFVVPDSPAKQYELVSGCLAVLLRGIDDPNIAVHSGDYDWLIHILMNCRGDIREFGFRSAIRRGVPLDQHKNAINFINL